MYFINKLESFVIFDLEWNRVYSPKLHGSINEIIEIGGVKIDSSLNVIDTFRVFVKPVFSKDLKKRVKKLTNLDPGDLDYGLSFQKAIKHFKEWSGPNSIFCTWGTNDIIVLKENFLFYDKNYSFNWLNLYFDLQKYCAMFLEPIDGQQFSLKKAAAALGIQFDEIKLHRALNDAKLSTEIFKKIIDLDKVNASIVPAVTINPHKNELILDILDSRINHKNFLINCPSCGCFLKKVKGWVIKSEQFWGLFRCNNCDTITSTYILIRSYDDEEIRYKKKSTVINQSTFDYLQQYFLMQRTKNYLRSNPRSELGSGITPRRS